MLPRLFHITMVTVCLAAPLHAQSFDDLVDKAKFIFVGDVVRLNATTMPTVRATPKTAVVRISDVLTGEDLFGGFRGEEITIEMLQPDVLEKTVFFSNVAVYGNSVEVVELGHQALGDDDGAAVRAKLAAALKRIAEKAILLRINMADRVIAGRVESVRRVGNAQRRSEHDPLWAVATVRVSSVLKGIREEQVEIMFPTSNDELWTDAPHFKVGDSGVWILRRERHERGLPRPIGALTALAPGDFRSMAELSRLRDLLAGRRL
jgi:hypothetical protein